VITAFSEILYEDAAWRWIGVKYESGEDLDYFLHDMTSSGPEVRFLLNF